MLLTSMRSGGFIDNRMLVSTFIAFISSEVK